MIRNVNSRTKAFWLGSAGVGLLVGGATLLGYLLPKEPLIALVPVSLRAEGDSAMNNQASMVRVDLATDIARGTCFVGWRNLPGLTAAAVQCPRLISGE